MATFEDLINTNQIDMEKILRLAIRNDNLFYKKKYVGIIYRLIIEENKHYMFRHIVRYELYKNKLKK